MCVQQTDLLISGYWWDLRINQLLLADSSGSLAPVGGGGGFESLTSVAQAQAYHQVIESDNQQITGSEVHRPIAPQVMVTAPDTQQVLVSGQTMFEALKWGGGGGGVVMCVTEKFKKRQGSSSKIMLDLFSQVIRKMKLCHSSCWDYITIYDMRYICWYSL